MNQPILVYSDGHPALGRKDKCMDRLRQLIISSRSLTVLEFGCGYSTIAISEALAENKWWWDEMSLREQPAVRNTQMFKLFCVDTDKKWMAEVKNYVGDNVVFHHSLCETDIFNDRLCHMYASLPNIVPDLIYLDGPDPAQVLGDINGMSFRCKERTPMSCDILVMEPTLLPGTRILIDGRINNVRFLVNNLQRDWYYTYDRETDQTLLELKERRLGKINVIGRDICDYLPEKT